MVLRYTCMRHTRAGRAGWGRACLRPRRPGGGDGHNGVRASSRLGTHAFLSRARRWFVSLLVAPRARAQRGERTPDPGAPQRHPKRVRFVFDLSGSM